MKDLLNCPNCGAPIEKDYCPYCGSVFLDWACFDVGRPTFVKIKDSRGDYRIVKLLVSSVHEKHVYEPVVLYGDNTPYEYVRSHRLTFEAEFEAVPFKHYLDPNHDILSLLIQPDKVDPQTLTDVVRGFHE